MVTLRPATLRDAESLWQWRRELPDVATFSPAGLGTFKDHLRWLRARLARPGLYIIEMLQRGNVGYVRCDREERQTMISVALGPSHRGHGIGLAALAEAQRIEPASPTHHFIALVRPENEASTHLFEKAGFRRDGVQEVNGLTALVYRWWPDGA